ncbi:hypothetical protein ABIB26_003144 [Arthrobacter sp. UYEF20]
MVLNAPFIPPITGHFLGRVLWESAGRGNTAIAVRKFWLALTPLEDRLAGQSQRAGVRETFRCVS